MEGVNRLRAELDFVAFPSFGTRPAFPRYIQAEHREMLMGQLDTALLRSIAEAETPRARVLVADRDDASREQISEVLRDDGYEVVSMNHGSEFVEYISLCLLYPDEFTMPDVIVADMYMPGFSSLDVLLKASGGAAVRLVVLSAFDDFHARHYAERLGALAFLKKGPTFAGLRNAVQDVVQQSGDSSFGGISLAPV